MLPTRTTQAARASVLPDSPEPLTTLRGAKVAVDVRRAGQVAAGICLVTLAVIAGVLFAAGAHKNAQISELRAHGVPVEITVSRCLGLIGGSGSNATGYTCWGSFTLGGHRYSEAIPGDAAHVPGATVRAVAVPRDPGLLSTLGAVANDRASWNVFVVPAALVIALAVLALALGLGRRHRLGAPTGRA